MKKNYAFTNQKKLGYHLVELLILLILAFNMIGVSKVQGQDFNWSQPLNISNTETHSTGPSLVTDSTGELHLVWLEDIESDFNLIMYSHKDRRGWTAPVDIFSSDQDKNITAPSLAIDQNGYLHIAFLGDGISYSQAYAPLANSARNWSTPTILYPLENFLDLPDIAAGPGGKIYIIFAIKNGENSGIYLFSSSDGGTSWEDPVIVFQNQSANRLIHSPKITLSTNEGLHVAWTETNYPETFPPLGIRYAHSLDGINWSSPVSIADGPYTELDIASKGPNEIHIAWSGTADDRYKFHRWSTDGGVTWSSIYRNMDGGGLLGPPSLVFDGQGKLHWLSAMDYFGPVAGERSRSYLYEYTFNEGSWSLGRLLFSTPLEINEQNLSSVSAVVSLGNEIHAVVMDPRLKADGNWQWDLFYSHRLLDIPQEIPKTLPTLTPKAKPVVLQPTPTFLPTVPSFELTEVKNENDPWKKITLALIPSALLLIIFISIKLFLRKR
jgi:hypothetical protein